MKKCICFIAVVVSFGSTTAMAQPVEQEKPREDFVNMEAFFMNGKIKGPNMQRVKSDRPTQFNRLLKLKKSFLGRIQNSTNGGLN